MSTANLTVRPAEPGDLSRICAIEEQSFSDPWSKKAFLMEMVFHGYNYAVVAIDEIADEVVGYCFFWVILADEIHIANIAVDPNRRKQGIGQHLIHFVCNVGKERQIPNITLEVRDSNQAAKAFYERLGFEQVGRRKNYYKKPVEDALILRLGL